jgi:hypothetical protein
MPKVITLTGMRQASALKGWDACDPQETRDSRGKAVVRCAGTKAITLSGQRPCKGPRCTKLGAAKMCSRKAISNWLGRAKRAVKVYDCDYAADLMYAIGECREEMGKSAIKGSTWKAMSSRVRSCYRRQGGVQRALKV